MDWRSAFFQQSQSDFEVFQALNSARVPYSHQLHYFQMLSEKLSKAVLLTPKSADPPEPSHAVFVRMLRTLKTRPDVRRQLGFGNNAKAFWAMIDGMLPLAYKLEQLAPALAGFTRPNPEYPWHDRASSTVFCPALYRFADFDLHSPPLVHLLNLVIRLLRIDW